MKTLLYPKTYARLLEIKKVNENKFIGRPYYTNIYVYEVMERDLRYPKKDNIFVGTGKIIEARNPGSSGSTPTHRLKLVEYTEKWSDIVTGRKTKRKSYYYDYTGHIFKLYQRPQDNGRWMYRWLGQ